MRLGPLTRHDVARLAPDVSWLDRRLVARWMDATHCDPDSAIALLLQVDGTPAAVLLGISSDDVATCVGLSFDGRLPTDTATYMLVAEFVRRAGAVRACWFELPSTHQAVGTALSVLGARPLPRRNRCVARLEGRALDRLAAA